MKGASWEKKPLMYKGTNWEREEDEKVCGGKSIMRYGYLTYFM